MTTFSPSQIPVTGTNAVTTLEQLALWALQGLNAINLTATAVEGDGAAQRVVQIGDFFISNNNTFRVVGRISFSLDPAYHYNNKKLWANVTEVSTTALPTSFTS